VTKPPPPTPPRAGVLTTPTGAPPAPLDWRERIIVPSADDDGPPALSVQLTGEYGVGKSEGALSFPDCLCILADPNAGRVKSRGVPYVSIAGDADYDAFMRDILPRLEVRDPYFEKYKTIVFDSLSFNQIDVRETVANIDDESRSRGAYAQLKRDTIKPLNILSKLPKAPKKGAYVWNVVVVCHLALYMKEIKSTGTGGKQVTQQIPLGWKPLLEGGSRDLFNGFGDTILVMKKEKVTVGQSNTSPGTQETRYFAYSQEPDALYYCKDSVGYGGKWNQLPPRLDITGKSLYDELTAAWGFPK
jgi:hypothetical protein